MSRMLRRRRAGGSEGKHFSALWVFLRLPLVLSGLVVAISTLLAILLKLRVFTTHFSAAATEAVGAIYVWLSFPAYVLYHEMGAHSNVFSPHAVGGVFVRALVIFMSVNLFGWLLIFSPLGFVGWYLSRRQLVAQKDSERFVP